MESKAEYWNIDPNAGQLLQAVIHTQKPQEILEIGTSNGCSAILMGHVASQYGGHITTIEFFEERVKLARENIEKEGLSDTITVIQGDAMELMANLVVSSRPVSRDPGASTWMPDQVGHDNDTNKKKRFDFMFLDANKEEYAMYFKYAMQMIEPNGIIIADNTLSHAKKLSAFFEAVQKEPRAHALELSIGTGLMVIRIE